MNMISMKCENGSVMSMIKMVIMLADENSDK